MNPKKAYDSQRRHADAVSKIVNKKRRVHAHS